MATQSSMTQNNPSASQSGAKKSVSDDVDALRSDIASLASSVSKLASETVGSTVGEAQVKAGEKLGDLETSIRRNPTQSAMIAVGIGFLFGLILTR
jgi:ElaB/YqjD/DUF883 family membrane-anchored ribosome-binding protein